jgi:hypothetical protein
MATTAPPSELARQIRATVEEWRTAQPLLAIRVQKASAGPTLAACELWTAAVEPWACRAVLHAGVGLTFDDVQLAVLAAGYRYTATREAAPRDGAARAAWRYDANDARYTLDISPAR